MTRLARLVVPAVLLALPGSASAAQTIQPGAYHVTGSAGCTLNFIFNGTGGPYVGTAAHCVESVGQASFDADGALIGTVAAIGNADAATTDWALIRIDGSALSRVSAVVLGHPGVPNGVATAAQTALKDRLLTSGWGLGFEFTAKTRQGRQSFLMYDDFDLYKALGTFIYGDSGGPVVHGPTGRALGIVSRLCIDVCEQEGPTITGIISRAAAKGFSITLRRA